MSEKSAAVDAWEALFRAQVTMMRELSTEFPTDRIALSEYDVLFNLSRQPERQARIRDLHSQLLLTQPSVSRMADRLAARGLVEKLGDPVDGRGTVVRLTDAGFDLFRQVAVAHAESISRRMTAALTAEELATLESLCERVRAAARQRA